MTKHQDVEASHDQKRSQKHRRHTWLRLTGGLALAGLFVAGVSSSVTATEANWANTEYAESNAVTATTINPPRNLDCDAPSLVGRPTLEWDFPEEGPPDHYVMEVRHNTTGDINRYVIDDGRTTELYLSRGVLENLLGNLLGLGGTYTARIQASGPEAWQWTSEFSNSQEFYTGVLGSLFPSC